MVIPPLSGPTGIVAVAMVTVLCYRFAVSPAVRALSRRSTPLRLAIAVATTAVPLALPAVPVPGPLRWFIAFAVALLTWQGTTSDYDLAQPLAPQRRDKLLLLALAVASCFWAPVLLLWMAVCCGKMRGWKHHAMMPLRMLKAYLAWFLAAVLLNAPAAGAALLVALGCVSLSHYVKPAWSKARLGPRPWSWAWHNRTHHLAASAYCWGWARFLPAGSVAHGLRRLRVLDRPFNLLTMAVEAAGLFAFFDRRLLVGALLATVLFNLAVTLASGIFFWENMCTNGALAAAVAALPQAHYAAVFSWPVATTALVILSLSCADLLWQPAHLAWWDSPLTARIHWQVETTSGVQLGLYNSFMCPYEREFGRVLGYFLTKEPILHGHLGIVWDRDLRDHIVRANGDSDALRVLKQTYGTVHWNEAEARAHEVFLTTMFTRLNAGAPKGPLPRCLRYFKAPGGQLYSWGDLPPYRGEETIRRITIRYQEHCYRPATGDFALLADRAVHQIELPTPTPDRENSSCATSSSTAVRTSGSS